MRLNEEQRDRYARNIVLPGVGEEGQERLLSSKVLVVGAGGLGSAVIQYLAAAGVGHLGIVDGDRVELSNLQRQTIHDGRLGEPKAESAREFVEKLNPDVEVEAHTKNLTPANARGLAREYDVLVDCSDNYETRYLANDVAIIEDKPLAHGSVFQFEGHATTVLPGEGPCYRCIFQRAPPPETRPRQPGVFGVLPGVIGSLQATETLKYLLDTGELLVGRLLYYDAMYMEFEEIETRRRKECPVCGESPSITELSEENYIV